MLTGPMVDGLTILSLSVVAALGARPLRGHRGWTPIRAVSASALVVGLVLLAWAASLAAGDRSPRTIGLGPGVRYERIAVDEPRRQVFHLVTAELDHRCVDLTTTSPDLDGTVPAETGTGFVSRTGAVASINVAFFFPIREFPPWDAYPGVGDPITAIGTVVVDGERRGWPGQPPWRNGLALTAGQASAGPVPDDADLAVPAAQALVVDGIDVSPPSSAYPRSVAAVDVDDNVLFLVVADGKQPGYADGSTYRDVAALLIERGADEAVELDGGGSATLAATVDGRVELLSRSSHQRLPGRQRPVATHLGITVEPSCR